MYKMSKCWLLNNGFLDTSSSLFEKCHTHTPIHTHANSHITLSAWSQSCVLANTVSLAWAGKGTESLEFVFGEGIVPKHKKWLNQKTSDIIRKDPLHIAFCLRSASLITHALRSPKQKHVSIWCDEFFCPSWASCSWAVVALWWTLGWQGQCRQYWLFTPLLLYDLIRGQDHNLNLQANRQVDTPGGVSQVCKHHLKWLEMDGSVTESCDLDKREARLFVSCAIWHRGKGQTMSGPKGMSVPPLVYCIVSVVWVNHKTNPQPEGCHWAFFVLGHES